MQLCIKCGAQDHLIWLNLNYKLPYLFSSPSFIETSAYNH